MVDLEAFYEYAKNPNVGPHAGWKPHESLEESREILKEFLQWEDHWAIVPNEDGKMMGSIGLVPDGKRENARVRMLGYALAEPCWGKGYMTEAVKAVIEYGFHVLNLDLISIYHYTQNDRSRRVIEKCGFQCEGTMRQSSLLYNGEVRDEVIYSMTREEYRHAVG